MRLGLKEKSIYAKEKKKLCWMKVSKKEKYSEKVEFFDYFALNLAEKVDLSTFPTQHKGFFQFLKIHNGSTSAPCGHNATREPIAHHLVVSY
jgi:hypothetical protein